MFGPASSESATISSAGTFSMSSRFGLFQRDPGAPAEKKRCERVGRRPLQDVGHIGPKVLLLDAGLESINARDNEAVEFSVANFAERAVEFEDMVGGRIARRPPVRDPADVSVGRQKTEADLQRGVAEPERELPFG